MATTDESANPTMHDVADAADDEALLPPVRRLSDEEWWALIDRRARRYLGMSGEEFARAWKSGEFDADPDRTEVQRLAMMLPLDE